MITLYNAAETDFNNNGLGIITATKAEVTEELNGAYELTMTVPYIERTERIIRYLLCFNIIKAPTPRGNQLFRIYQVRKMLSGEIQVNARHIFYDGLFNMVKSVKGSNMSVSAALQAIYNNAAYAHRFSVSSNMGNTVSFEYENTTPVACILGEGGLIEAMGAGEILRDNFSIGLNESIGAYRGFAIRYRKNLTGLDIEENSADVATRVMPIAQDAEGEILYLPETYIDSSYVNSYFMPLYGTLECNDIRVGSDEYPTADSAYTEMRNRVQTFFVGGGDKPLINAKINFVLLGNTTEYAEYKDLEQIYLGDTVTVVHDGLGVDLQAKCIKYSYNAVLERYNSIEVGEFRGDFAVSTTRNIGKLQTETAVNVSLTGRVDSLEIRHANHAHTGTDGTVQIKQSNILQE